AVLHTDVSLMPRRRRAWAAWNYHVPKGAENPDGKVMLTYKTAANNWIPKVGAVESLAEAAVAQEALSSGKFHDVEFQPISFEYLHPSGNVRTHTIDFRLTLNSGQRCFVFVRNSSSLKKPRVKEQIEAIKQAAPTTEAHTFAVIDADGYSRARRDNLRRMYWLTTFEADAEADAIVKAVAFDLKTLWRVSDLFDVIDLPNGRTMKASLRLIARGVLCADMNAVIGSPSRIWRPTI
ncbi:MAG: hypothetical protein P8X50_15465, partial [Maritimibacter sp.]